MRTTRIPGFILAAGLSACGEIQTVERIGHVAMGESAAAGPALVFAASDLRGNELWRTNGTARGTLFVKDIDPAPTDVFGNGSSQPYRLTSVGRTVFFAARDAAHGQELWATDGRPSQTRLVKDINPGPLRENFRIGSSYPDDFAVLGDTLYFRACDEEHGPELWRSDGTENGTVLVKDIYPGPGAFGAGSGRAVCLDNRGPSDLVVMGHAVYFFATHPAYGRELWRSDGTPEGTVLVKDTRPGPDPPPIARSSGIAVGNLVRAGDTLLFAGPGGLWRSDGTEGGTARILEDFVALLTGARSQAFFVGVDGLWRTDGTREGTRRVRSVHIPTDIRFQGRVARMVAVGDSLFFDGNATGGLTGDELWRSDGTEDGTAPLSIGGADAPLQPTNLTPVGDRLYFTARDTMNRHAIWRADRAGSPVRVTDPELHFSALGFLAPLGSRLVFGGQAPEGVGLWSMPLPH